MTLAAQNFYEYIPQNMIQPQPPVDPQALAALATTPEAPASAPVPTPPAPVNIMPDLGLFLSSVGANDPDSRAELTAEIYVYVFRVAIEKLDQALSEGEKQAAKLVMTVGPLSAETFGQFFQSPARQQVLQEVLTDALNTVSAAAAKTNPSETV